MSRSATTEPVAKKPPCPQCGKDRLKNGHDPCISDLPGVWFACCGHDGSGGFQDSFRDGFAVPYISEPGRTVYGQGALERMRELGGNPPDLTPFMVEWIRNHTLNYFGVVMATWEHQSSTLTARAGERTITFTDWAREGDIIDVYEDFDDAEVGVGNSVPMMLFRRADNDWHLESEFELFEDTA